MALYTCNGNNQNTCGAAANDGSACSSVGGATDTNNTCGCSAGTGTGGSETMQLLLFIALILLIIVFLA